MPPVGFEPTISAGERPQTYAFDRAVHNLLYWVGSLVRAKYGLPCYALLYVYFEVFQSAKCEKYLKQSERNMLADFARLT